MTITHKQYCLNCSRFVHEEEDSHLVTFSGHALVNYAIDSEYFNITSNSPGFKIGAPVSGTSTVTVSGFDSIEDAINFIVASGISVLNPSLSTPTAGIPGATTLEQAILQNQVDIATSSGALQAQLSSNDSDIGSLQADLSTSSGTLQSQISNNDVDIFNLQTDLSSASGTLQSQISSNDSDISDLQSDLSTSSGTLQSQIDSNDSDISTLQVDLTSASGTLQADVDTRVLRSGDTMTGFLNLSADPTSSGHASNKHYVDLNLASVSGNLQIQIDNNAGDINTIEGDIITLSGSIEDLETQLSLLVDDLNFVEVDVQSVTSTTSSTYVTMASMSITPVSGTHYVSFSAEMQLSNANSTADYAIFVDETLESTRTLAPKSNGNFPVHTQTNVTVDGTNVVTMRYRITAGALTVRGRNMITLRVGD